MKTIINEGLAKINVENKKIVSKEMEVFYNPVMGINRDISVLLLNSINNNDLQIADPLAASGIRSIRFLKELNKDKISRIYINDFDKNAVKSIKENLILNKIKYKNNKKMTIENEDANLFLLKSTGFDYTDVDPFGTPNPFLDAACKRLARDGILAVTATDTSALAGTYPQACIRKYWAAPKKDALMHETGLRILIRKIQLVAAQYDKALTPIFSYSKEHYMRVFLRNGKGKNKADEILKMHGLFNNAGPMWLGNLFDSELCSRIYQNSIKNKTFNKNNELIKFLKMIKDESKINTVGFYDLNDVAEKNKIKTLPKKESIKNKIRKMGYKASDTHFKGEGIRSDIPLKELIRILRKI
ncbi:MAG TPA: tRNA (guanine(26)-N(2))-dimethyltransferase [Candidatus Nanoarchaeia archaeon]|nr:tRNA (guanine(26)-N(2))-dimethyltransferase [Candidatus Nanoarchaeia archaeon]